MNEKEFLKKYFHNLKLLLDNNEYMEKLISTKNILKGFHSAGSKNNDFWKWWKRSYIKSF